MSISGSMQYGLYLPRVLVEWQAHDTTVRHIELDGTLVFSDISGFTALSEKLAEKGKVGSEEVTSVINGAFSELLDVASLDGGDLLKFGGDAMLTLFTGDEHEARAARAAFDMRDALEEFQGSHSPVDLQMSVGIASGPITMVLAGELCRELLIIGETAERVLELESTADAGEILVAPETVDAIDDDVAGDEKGPGLLLEDAPDPDEPELDDIDGVIDYEAYIPVRLRPHLTISFNEGEHRMANIGFVKIAGVGPILDRSVDDTAEQLHSLVSAAQRIADRYGVTSLATDISEDGAKLILATGVPGRADEEEERILRAAHEIAGIETDLYVAVGVARGNVFSGDLGSRIRRSYTVMGDTVNLAARLAFAAKKGTVLTTAKVLDRTASDFEAIELEPMSLKGKSIPIRPREIRSVVVGSRSITAADLPLVGRIEELGRLADAQRMIGEGAGMLMQPHGDAGIGKTRLVQELIATTDERVVVATAEPYESATPFHVAGQIVRNVLGLDADAGGDDLESAVREVGVDLLPWLPIIGGVAGIPTPSTPEVDALDDRFHAGKTGEVLADLVTRTLHEPSVIVVEGAEWTDAASNAVFDRAIAEIEFRPWLVVFTSRRLVERLESATQIQLEPLSDEETRSLMEHALGDHPVPVSQLDAMTERAAGNPFFAVELATAVRAGVTSLPENVEAAAARRIDSLDLRDRRLLRSAAVLGRQFKVDLLADALPELAPALEDPAVWTRLAEFVDASGSGTVRFRQPMVRDVAYEGLPFSRRQELHRSIGEALERRARRRPERFADALSLHFHHAGDADKAWEYSVMAAERARKKYANTVATELYERALSVSEAESFSVPLDQWVEVAEALGDVADLAGLHELSGEAYRRALDDTDLGPLDTARVRRKLAMVDEKLGNYRQAKDLLSDVMESLSGATGEASENELAEAMLGFAGILNREADPKGSVEWCRKIIDRDPPDHRVLAHAYNLLETNYTDLNDPDRGTFYERALEIYRAEKDLVGEAKVLNNLGYDAYFRGDWVAALARWEEGLAASQKAGDVVTAAATMHNIGEIELDQGHLEAAGRRLRDALRMWRGARFSHGVAFASANLGRLHARLADFDGAHRYFDQAYELFRQLGGKVAPLEVQANRVEAHMLAGSDHSILSEIDADIAAAEDLEGTGVIQARLHRLRGYRLLLEGNDDGAVECWERSLELGVESGAPFEEAQTRWALSALATRSGVPDEHRRRAEQIFAELGIEGPPPMSLLVV